MCLQCSHVHTKGYFCARTQDYDALEENVIGECMADTHSPDTFIQVQTSLWWKLVVVLHKFKGTYAVK